MTTVNSHIKYLLSAVLFFHCVYAFGQNEEEWSLFTGNFPAIVANANVGSAIPFPFYNIPEERHANMILQPYLGLQLNHSISPKNYLKFNIAYSGKACDFSATLVDQPYNGSMDQEVNGVVSEVYVEDAYFSGNSEGSYRLKYVELNSSFGRKIGKNSGVYLGFYLAFLLEAENEVFVDGTVSLGPRLPAVSTQFQRIQDYEKYINKTDFGLQLGYEHRLVKNLNANGQFSTGLYSIYSKELEAVEFAMVNMYVSLGFTYYIGSSLFD